MSSAVADASSADHDMYHFLMELNLLDFSELEKIKELVSTKIIRKGDYLIRKGSVCKEIVWIKSGILRSFYINTDGVEITNCLAFDNELMAAFSSFITQHPTEENIQAIVDSEIEVLTKDQLNTLYTESTQWQTIGRILTEYQYVQLEQRIVSFQKYTAKQRYEELLANHAHYIQNVPLQYLATYLGMTPRHLSRLRGKY
ncbi:MAG: Crp/Fnr family transcriptional regulator [Saprospiraceae bacterium]|nr:Crp/Fnr family transcriptional regulator [Saprospiraceae bacterium]